MERDINLIFRSMHDDYVIYHQHCLQTLRSEAWRLLFHSLLVKVICLLYLLLLGIAYESKLVLHFT